MLNASLSGPMDAFGGVSAEARRNTPQMATSAPLPEALSPHSVGGFSVGKNASGIAVPWLAVPPQSGKVENDSDASRSGLHRQANPYQDVPSLYGCTSNSRSAHRSRKDSAWTFFRYSPQDFPIASAEFQRIVSLPCSPAMSDDDVENVIAAVTSVIEENSVRRTSTAAFSATGS